MTDKNPHLPTHVAFIMDGNGRWAQARGWARLRGHGAGVESVKRVIEQLAELHIPYATFYAFSTDNWKRSPEEVNGLFSLMREWFAREIKTLQEKSIRVRFIGDHTPASRGGKLADDIVELMQEVAEKTAGGTAITATFAINYSGQDELTRAAAKLAASGNPITTEALENALDTAGLPPPDFIIRTSGEQRLSGFLLWQAAYAELYFTNTSWPDFGSTHLQAALSAYTTRQRRFGAVPPQTSVA